MNNSNSIELLKKYGSIDSCVVNEIYTCYVYDNRNSLVGFGHGNTKHESLQTTIDFIKRLMLNKCGLIISRKLV